MSNQPIVSVIVPVFNVEKYLKRCIESVLQQSLSQIELILINDGSPDNCAQIINEYAKSDQRIVVVHQSNKGVSAARNAGLRLATGKYIGFVDADDYIEKDMYENLVGELERTTADISCCNWNDISTDGSIRENVINNVESEMNHQVFLGHIFDIPYSILPVVCNKLFIKKRIKTYFPENCAIGEDTAFLINYALEINKACFIDKRLYNVTIREESATRLNPDRMVEGLEIWKQAIQLVSHENRKTRWLAERMYLDRCQLYMSFNGDYGERASKQMSRYLKSNFYRVICNREIYWKTRILYTIDLLRIHH